MNLIYFIRLLFKNVLLILGVGFVMAGLVYLLTRGQPRTYTSSTTIYTGIATGYDIESGSNARFDLFANNAQFDNLINIIKSRETQEKTAIRLMAQHLVLNKPDPKFCLPSTWQALMSVIPVEIKQMVEHSYSETPRPAEQSGIPATERTDSITPAMDSIQGNVADSVVEEQTVTSRVLKYHPQKKYYIIKAGDSPNSVSQKFGITPGDLKKFNSPMPPFQGGTRLVVGVVMEPEYIDTVITAPVKVARREKPAEPLPQKAAQSAPVYKTDIVGTENSSRYERLVKEMTGFKEADQDNYLFNTLQSSNPFYSVQKISSVRVTRIQSSDLIKLSFDSDDPAVSMQTLKILTDVFRSQYQAITARQTGLVSDYFRQRVNDAKRQLDSLEQDLLHFRMKNRIINYDEQTKFISEQKETLDRDWYEEAGKYSAAKTALSLVEQNLGEKGKSIFQNSSVLLKRQQVYELALRISMEEVKRQSTAVNPAGESEPVAQNDSLIVWKRELEKLKVDLNDQILKSFELNRTVQGLNIQSVLDTWLIKAIEVEEAHARYNTLTERKNAFLVKYDEFAPLGSQLKKIEREIDLAQQDYMNHLNNLNQSIMKQKNVEQSDIQVIDNPVYPLKPNSSKRMFTVIAAFIAGLVLTASALILLEFLDTSIKFLGRFSELTGLKLIGAFPRIPLNPDFKINYPLISSRVIDQIAQRIRLENLRQTGRSDQQFILFIISTREQEGKTFLATRIVEKLRASGSRVLYVKPLEKTFGEDIRQQFNNFDQPQQAWDFEYPVPENFLTVRNINDLLRNYTFLTQGYHYLIVELPALLVKEFPATMVNSGNLTVLVGQATRIWNKADDEAIRLYLSSIEHPALALLNGCQPDELESFIGEIPKRRNLIRKILKRLVNLTFKIPSS